MFSDLSTLGKFSPKLNFGSGQKAKMENNVADLASLVWMYSKHDIVLVPTFAPRQVSKSFFMSETGILSWGLLGPLQHGTTVLRSNSTT